MLELFAEQDSGEGTDVGKGRGVDKVRELNGE